MTIAVDLGRKATKQTNKTIGNFIHMKFQVFNPEINKGSSVCVEYGLGLRDLAGQFFLTIYISK